MPVMRVSTVDGRKLRLAEAALPPIPTTIAMARMVMSRLLIRLMPITRMPEAAMVPKETKSTPPRTG